MIDVAWLRGLGPERLELLLERRSDCAASPVPESLSELAERLTTPWTVVETLRRLDRPTLQAAEALAALGGSAPLQDLARLLGNPKPDHLDKALSTLCDHALLVLDPQPTLVPAAATAWPHPLQLGPPAASTVHHHNVQQLKGIANALGVAAAGRRAEVVRAVLAALGDHELVRKVVNTAPKAIRDELIHSATSGAPIEITSFYYHSSHRGSPASTKTDRWAMERGLLARSDAVDGLMLIAEVALALRGPDYHAPFDPEPPHMPMVNADQRVVDSGGLAAVSAFGNIVTAVLDEAGRKPIAVLKAGGVGTRELKRLSRSLGATELEVRLALSIGYQMSLWEADEAGGAPTSDYDDWLAESPADRLAGLMQAVWTLPQVPLGEEGTWQPLDIEQVAGLRRRVVSEIPVGMAVVDPGSLAARVAWGFPYGVGDPSVASHFIGAAWRELELTGIVAGGAVTSAGRALLAGGAGLIDALAAVGSAQTTARFQADLTAVVTGTPSAELTRLLDAAADRESRGTASTWRFSSASVRRALDAGMAAADLHEALSKVAGGGVPQPLEYLLSDVARQHGSVRVRVAVCCLRSDDIAMLERLTADRKLADLGLRPLAPTVITSAKPVDETLAALRSAGYSPVAEDADGVVILERQKPGRTAAISAPEAKRTKPKVPEQPTLADLVKNLLAAPDVVEQRSSETMKSIELYAKHLTGPERRVLAYAIDAGTPIIIAYVNQQGNETVRAIDDIELVGGSLYAWCHLRDDARSFNLGRVLSVQPA